MQQEPKNPVVGELECPIMAALGQREVATVHQESGRRKALYYRSSAGTIQPRTMDGQDAIRALMKKRAPTPKPEPKPEPTPEPTPEPKPAPEQKPSFQSRIAEQFRSLNGE